MSQSRVFLCVLCVYSFRVCVCIHSVCVYSFRVCVCVCVYRAERRRTVLLLALGKTEMAPSQRKVTISLITHDATLLLSQTFRCGLHFFLPVASKIHSILYERTMHYVIIIFLSCYNYGVDMLLLSCYLFIYFRGCLNPYYVYLIYNHVYGFIPAEVIFR
ncbi:hypothetical protein COCON_G00167490 [Conger conger]|uniref:Uncharacterized protein n=1 Tax=Conger conger TaxID=82655 RepID=A0A9Q1D778_CONCO|nr:hypothetical protein COCON_G00167490 [Conger conger]